MTDPDLVTNLRATLAEVRVRAEAASIVTNTFHEDGYEVKANWSLLEGNDTFVIAGEKWTQTDDHVCHTDDEPAYAAHIAYWDPATVLRMVAATEKIVAMHEGSHECCSEEDNCVWIGGWDCETVKGLAEMWGWTGE